MTTAILAARCLTDLGAAGPELHAMLYFAQGWHLGFFGRSFFPEPIHAGPDGPVVPGLPDSTDPSDPTALAGRDRVFLEVVWDRYKPLSPAELVEQVRNEPPWREAHAHSPGAEITPASLRRSFAARPEAVLVNPGELEAVYRGEAAARVSVPVPLDDVFGRARARAATPGVPG